MTTEHAVAGKGTVRAEEDTTGTAGASRVGMVGAEVGATVTTPW